MDFYKACRFLKSMSMAQLPIKVRRIPLKNLDGSCEKKKKCFLIKVNKNLTEAHSLDVLLHELAHVFTWHNKKDNFNHGPAWGIAYAKIYRIFVKWLEENEC